MSTSTRSRHMRRKVIPIVALAAAGAAAGGIAVLSGCGSTASAGSAPASIAGYVPASSPLYVQVSTDTAGTQAVEPWRCTSGRIAAPVPSVPS